MTPFAEVHDVAASALAARRAFCSALAQKGYDDAGEAIRAAIRGQQPVYKQPRYDDPWLDALAAEHYHEGWVRACNRVRARIAWDRMSPTVSSTIMGLAAVFGALPYAVMRMQTPGGVK